MLFAVGVSCRILYSMVSYLYLSCNGSCNYLGWEERELSLLSFTCNYVVSYLERFPLPLSAWDGLRTNIICFMLNELHIPSLVF